ncbi:MAG: methyltransferase [Clostridia bacterium]|nr:methyltransferase [Clostridia bacterium]MBQ3092145.1 methyltransferase [Clostridia bacterium]MBQ9924702.1 methyltransferase [Clostridia bacterium]
MRHQNYLFPGHPIIQDDQYFKLSQDSVVLSSFARVKKNEKLLDLGCGIGVLTLLMLLRCPGCRATGLEITEGAAALARENLALNGLEDRGEILHGDMRELPKNLYGAYDVCISNPPYFDPGRGFSSRTDILATARNERSGDIYDVCRTAGNALKWGGRFYVCYPPVRLTDLLEALRQSKLEPKVMRLVFPDDRHEPCLVLIEARKGGGAGLKIQPSLMIAEKGEKTEEFKRIYQLEEPTDAR